jgi:HTH-type transcriptional regulator/antitoxin HigA
MTNIRQLTSSTTIHPGETLKDELEARNIKQKDFSELIGMQASQLNEILKGKRSINAEMALIIGKALKMDPKTWINLQANYELDLAKVNKNNMARIAAIDEWEKITPYIPAKYFKKQEVITGDPLRDIPIIKSIFNLRINEDFSGMKQVSFRYRHSKKLAVDKVNLLGWTKLIAYDAARENVKEFDVACKNDVVTKLREIILINRQTVSKCTEILHYYGIKFIIRENPSQCPVDGVSLWSGDNPTIGMTLRYSRIDNFAFTLFHELGHIFSHLLKNKTKEFVDVELSMDDNDNKEEAEANEFAMNNLIDPNLWETFVNDESRLQEDSIIKFAHKVKIHPQVVKGRICHELNFYKFKTEKIEKDLC